MSGAPLPLSTREREVALLVAEGLHNAEIAAQLGISVATVKDHIHRILERLSLRSRQDLAVAMARTGAPLRPPRPRRAK
jgi:DNA-binding NarL/FixJ family response regulator